MKSLVVPVHVDALLLPNSIVVKEALADYRKLPHTDGNQDFNPDNPYLGSTITSKPLEGVNLLLNRGVHLHWMLPTALRKTVSIPSLKRDELDVHFPAVPDRWLINRRKNDAIERTWLIESNYVSEQESESEGNSGAVNVPFHDDQANNKTQPFRFLGKSIDVTNGEEGYSINHTGESYVKEVTAIGYNPQPGTKGYGEQTFAAFYPNCASVFGFYDTEITAEDESISYEVIGVYSDVNSDYFNLFIKDFENQFREDEEYLTLLNEALRNEFLIEVKDTLESENDLINREEDVPKSAVYYGKAIPELRCAPATDQVDFFVGNTATEALSAYLANNPEREDAGEVEELLEAIQFSSTLQNKVLDVGHKLQEARHQKGFTAIHSGKLWLIKKESNHLSAQEHNEATGEEIALDDSLALLLNETNLLQATYNQKALELVDLRKQLFSDWNKYMIAAYPQVDNETFFFDQDELQNYLTLDSIAVLKAAKEALGELSIVSDEGGFSSASANGTATCVAHALANKLNELRTAIQGLSTDQENVVLRQTVASRYWKPNDPVILLAEAKDTTGKVLENTRIPAPDASEFLSCKLYDFTVDLLGELTISDVKNIMAEVHDLFADTTKTGVSREDGIWNPFMIEWEAEYLSVVKGSNHELNNRSYAPNFIDENYALQEKDPDFSLKDSASFGSATVFTGSSIMTTHVNIHLDESIKQFLSNHGDNQTDEMKTLVGVLQGKLSTTNTMTHSLGGFHEAMLGQIQSRQLDVADPIGFKPYQDFADQVNPFIDNINTTSPDPLLDFHPLRSGIFRLLNLRMIDTFGQVVDFKLPNTSETSKELFLNGSETVRLNSQNGFAHLKPRFSQPARLNFRFLSATNGEQESNHHPAASPICGWLLPNNLEQSIDCYDQAGNAIGAITMNASNPWRPAPNSAASGTINAIKNTYFRSVVNFLYDRQVESIETNEASEPHFLANFLNTLKQAEQNIAPENFAEHLDLALLMGKPLAVVRLKLNLQLAGLPRKEQSWTDLMHQLRGRGRSSADFTKVKVPIRIGEYQQLNDGLFGYWLEDESGRLSTTYFSAEGGENNDPYIKTYALGGAPLTLGHAIDDPALCMTTLVDPRGSIHAVSGVLPVKSIALPKDQYAASLKNISITFLTTPVLSPERHLKVTVPKEAGFEWQWLQKTRTRKWHTINETVIISKELVQRHFADQSTLWDRLLELDWLRLIKGQTERAVITSKALQPTSQPIENPIHTDVVNRLDEFFDIYGERIEPFNNNLQLDNKQIIREGWLQLGRKEDTLEPSDTETETG